MTWIGADKIYTDQWFITGNGCRECTEEAMAHLLRAPAGDTWSHVLTISSSFPLCQHTRFSREIGGSAAPLVIPMGCSSSTPDEKSPPMDWKLRHKIAVGTARGLHYLDKECHRRIIHRDIKFSNILLTTNLEASAAYKQADGRKLDNRRVLVDVERGRTVPNWHPRRLGGGLGSTRIGGEYLNHKHSGRALVDYLEGNEEEYKKYRYRIVRYIMELHGTWKMKVVL